jgi:hypothetical protein
MDGIHLAEDRDQWRGVVETVMNLRVPLNVRKSLYLSDRRLLKKESPPWS